MSHITYKWQYWAKNMGPRLSLADRVHAPTICDSMDCSPVNLSFQRISQASLLEWVANSFSRGSSLSKGQIRLSWVSRVSCIASGFSTTWTI